MGAEILVLDEWGNRANHLGSHAFFAWFSLSHVSACLLPSLYSISVFLTAWKCKRDGREGEGLQRHRQTGRKEWENGRNAIFSTHTTKSRRKKNRSTLGQRGRKRGRKGLCICSSSSQSRGRQKTADRNLSSSPLPNILIPSLSMGIWNLSARISNLPVVFAASPPRLNDRNQPPFHSFPLAPMPHPHRLLFSINHSICSAFPTDHCYCCKSPFSFAFLRSHSFLRLFLFLSVSLPLFLHACCKDSTLCV